MKNVIKALKIADRRDIYRKKWYNIDGDRDDL
jgi:hypothetical protein